ncbi:MAG: hypothetical protein JEZ04_17865 [Spirochaetales bacterium]|nr:hypothetical protein [Spirochaetales bacterium]
MAIKNKDGRMNQLTAMLEAHPEGLRRAEIARRMGIHRSTVGRYIDQLSLSLPIWERDSRIGLEETEILGTIPGFDIYEGTFILFLLKLYEQELNIKSPHAASFIRKISASYRNTAPVLHESLLQSAESLEIDEKRYSRGYNDNFDKMAAAWIDHAQVKINYNHKFTGESCSTLFKPQEFFTSRKREEGTNAAVYGLCQRTGECCGLYLSDFSVIDLPSSIEDAGARSTEGFCPISELGRAASPKRGDNRKENYCIQEANHRIKNSLFMISSLIDLTFSSIKDSDVTDKIRGLKNRIDAIGELHEQLSDNNGCNNIPLNKYLEKLVWKNITAMTPEPAMIRAKVIVDEFSLEAGKVLPLGMIISELLTNSFKYAITGDTSIISLIVTKHDGIVSARYSDGENKAVLGAENGKTGLKLIEGFCRQLDCKITYKKKHILLEFPV